MKVLWPTITIERSFDNFAEEHILIHYNSSGQPVIPVNTLETVTVEGDGYHWQDAVVDSLVKGMAGRKTKQKQQELRNRLMPGGEIAWEVIVDYWNEPVEN
jgi:hypothetical protein